MSVSDPSFLAQRQAIDAAIAAVHSRRRMTKALRVTLAGLEAARVELTRLADIAAVTSDEEVHDLIARASSAARSVGRRPVEILSGAAA